MDLRITTTIADELLKGLTFHDNHKCTIDNGYIMLMQLCMPRDDYSFRTKNFGKH